VAWILGICGYPDQALKRSHEALTLAQELAHPYSLAFALNTAAILCRLLREGQAAQERAEVLITLSTEQGFAPYLAEGTMLRGWALTEQRKEEEGLTQIQQGLAAQRVTGEELEQPYWLVLLAEAYGKVGRAEEGLSALAEALGQVDKTGARLHEAELYRLKGELLFQSRLQSRKSRVQEAESCFQQALAIARHQSAKSLELRAVMSLSRLWQQQGKRHEAHTMLSEVYHWFTEGLNTKDLQEAKALLEELA